MSQSLRAGTVLSVDVVDPAVESIRWTGTGSVTIYDPGWGSLGVVQSGAAFAPSRGAGTYKLIVSRDQSIGTSWDVSVLGQTDRRGRLSAKNWQFNAGSFSASAATDASFYALVPAGSETSRSVIELQLNGLAGYIYDINANRRGIDGPSAGRSVPEAGNSVTLEYAMYLQVPTLANFERNVPAVSGLSYAGGVSTNVLGETVAPCDQVLPGASQGYFSFSSATEGSYQLQCDLNRDGEFSIGSGQDLLLLGTAAVGANVVSWDGTHNGAPVASGTYTCRVKLTVGEFHYVGRDIETSYPGMRLFRVNADGSRTGLSMYWNDNLVQGNDTRMPNGAFGLVSSEGAILPGAYEAPAVANQNARSWGDFTGAGKGNVAYLDTYVWLDEATSAPIQVRAADLTDSDADGLSDFQESCWIGSDSTLADTDGDGVDDGAQYAVPVASAFSGLESNGRLASALARRSIRLTRMSVGDGALQRTTQPLNGLDSPARWLPAMLGDAAGVSDTPTDLLDVTNAVAVTGSDYVTGDGRRRGGALILTARGAFYEHQKSICDRVRGARLLEVRSARFRSVDVLQTVVTSSREGRLEYAMSLHLWEDESTLRPAAFWITEDAPSVPPTAPVVTLQVWGDSGEFVTELAEAIVQRIEAEQTVDWPRAAQPVDDAAYAPRSEPDPRDIGSVARAASPSALIENVRTLGGQLELSLRRVSGAGPVELEFSRVEQDAVTTTRLSVQVDAGAGSTRQTFDFEPFLETTIDLLDQGIVVDRVWASDGAWAAYDESVWQGGPALGEFSRECVSRDLFTTEQAARWRVAPSDGALQLSGCGRVTRTTPARGGVARALINPLDATSSTTLAFWISVDRPYAVCLENRDDSTCLTLPARPSGAWEAIPVSAFGGVASSAEVVTFATEKPSERMEVSGLTLLPPGASAPDTRSAVSSGCTMKGHGSGTRRPTSPWGLALTLGGLFVWIHRRRPRATEELVARR